MLDKRGNFTVNPATLQYWDWAHEISEYTNVYIES